MHSCYVISQGAVSNLATSWDETWNGLLAGRWSTIPFSRTGTGFAIDTPVGAVMSNSRQLSGEPFIEGSSLRLAVAACINATRDLDTAIPYGVYGGSTYSESDALMNLVAMHCAGTGSLGHEALWRSILYDSVAAQIDYKLPQAKHSTAWIYSSCTSAMHALFCASMDIMSGEIPTNALVFGVDALSVIAVAGFTRSGASTLQRCLPFHVNRDGTLISEGASAIVLSNKKPDDQGFPVCLRGIGLSCDAGHPMQPEPHGEGLQRAIEMALKNARLSPEDITGIVLHGTGTQANDAVEALVYKRIFGKYNTPAVSIKGSIGHTMGASGMFNCLVAVEACRKGLLPPTLDAFSPILPDINVVCGKPMIIKPGGPILVICSGFGGNNVVAIFGTKN